MKQVKEVRTYEASEYVRDSWFSRIDDETIRCICHSTLEKFWSIDGYEKKIEIVLTNWFVQDAVKMTTNAFTINFGGQLASCTPEQNGVITRFIQKHGKCLMYINVVNGNRRKKVTKR